MVCVGLSERDLKNFWGATGGASQNLGGAVATPGTPLAPPLPAFMWTQITGDAKSHQLFAGVRAAEQ